MNFRMQVLCVCWLVCTSPGSLSFSPCLAFLFKGRERGGAEFNVYFSLNELLLLTSRVIACDSFLCFHIIVRPETFNDFHKSSHSALFCPTKISTITSILLYASYCLLLSLSSVTLLQTQAKWENILCTCFAYYCTSVCHYCNQHHHHYHRYDPLFSLIPVYSILLYVHENKPLTIR